MPKGKKEGPSLEGLLDREKEKGGDQVLLPLAGWGGDYRKAQAAFILKKKVRIFLV